MRPLITRAASGRHTISCRHHGCTWYSGGHASDADAEVLGNNHMVLWHGIPNAGADRAWLVRR